MANLEDLVTLYTDAITEDTIPPTPDHHYADAADKGWEQVDGEAQSAINALKYMDLKHKLNNNNNHNPQQDILIAFASVPDPEFNNLMFTCAREQDDGLKFYTDIASALAYGSWTCLNPPPWTGGLEHDSQTCACEKTRKKVVVVAVLREAIEWIREGEGGEKVGVVSREGGRKGNNVAALRVEWFEPKQRLEWKMEIEVDVDQEEVAMEKWKEIAKWGREKVKLEKEKKKEKKEKSEREREKVEEVGKEKSESEWEEQESEKENEEETSQSENEWEKKSVSEWQEVNKHELEIGESDETNVHERPRKRNREEENENEGGHQEERDERHVQEKTKKRRRGVQVFGPQILR